MTADNRAYPERRDLAANLLGLGYPIRTTIDLAGVSKTTARRLARQIGRATGTQIEWETKRSEAVARYESGESCKDIALALGVSLPFVSRATRHLRGSLRHRIAPKRLVAPPSRSEWHRKRPHIKAERIIREMSFMLDGLVDSIALVDPATVDRDATREWVASLNRSVPIITRFIKEITHANCATETENGHQEDRPCVSPAVGAHIGDAYLVPGATLLSAVSR
jgi:transposase-like protein